MSLLIHCGARNVSREEVLETPAPEATKTHQPIEHRFLIEETERIIKENDVLIEDSVFAMTKDKMRMFGMYQIKSHHDYSTMLGVRNSNDKSFAAGLVIGEKTLVCDNLLFAGQYKVQRRHTKYIYDYLNQLLESFIGRIPEFQLIREDHLQQLKGFKITEDQANSLIIQGVKDKIVPPSKVLKVVQEWSKPGSTVNKDYSEFLEHGKSLWRLQNAFTTVLHSNKNIFSLPEKTMKLSRKLLKVAG